MTKTVRVYWKGVRRRLRANYNWPYINQDSIVLVTASEYALNPASPDTSKRFVGDAMIHIAEISPHGPPWDGNHGVTFLIKTDRNAPLNVVTDITVIDPSPDIEQFQYSPDTTIGGDFPHPPGGSTGSGGTTPPPGVQQQARPEYTYECAVEDDHIKVTVKGTGFPPDQEVVMGAGFDNGTYMAFGMHHSCHELYPNPGIVHATSDSNGEFEKEFIVPVECIAPCTLNVNVVVSEGPPARPMSKACGCSA